MGQVTLYSADDEGSEINAEIGSSYQMMLNELEEKYDSEEEMIGELCRIIEATVYQEAQEQNQGHELHSAFAELIRVFEKRGEVNLKRLTENSIHQLTQMSEQ